MSVEERVRRGGKGKGRQWWWQGRTWLVPSLLSANARRRDVRTAEGEESLDKRLRFEMVEGEEKVGLDRAATACSVEASEAAGEREAETPGWAAADERFDGGSAAAAPELVGGESAMKLAETA